MYTLSEEALWVFYPPLHRQHVCPHLLEEQVVDHQNGEYQHRLWSAAEIHVTVIKRMYII